MVAPLNISDEDELFDVNDTILDTAKSVASKFILYSESAMGFMCNPDLGMHYAAYQKASSTFDESEIEKTVAQRV